MLNFEDYVKENNLPISKIQDFYKSCAEKAAAGLPIREIDAFIREAFPNRVLDAVSKNEMKMPSVGSMKRGAGSTTIFERHYTDSDIHVTATYSVKDYYYACQYEFNEEYHKSGMGGGVVLAFKISFAANGVKTVEKLSYEGIDVAHDFHDLEIRIGRDIFGGIIFKYLNGYAEDLDRRVARAKAKAARQLEKEENRDPVKVRANFMTKATKVEKIVFERLETEYKKVLEDAYYDFATTIRKEFEELKNARYPMKFTSASGYVINYAFTPEEAAKFRFGSEAWLCTASEKEVRDFAAAQAILEIASVLVEVKKAGGDIAEVSNVRIGNGCRLNALFNTKMGNVNVLTFPAAIGSSYMRPHLRTKTTLLKN